MPAHVRGLSHKKVPDAWQTHVQGWLRLGFPWSWLFIAALLFGLGWAVLYKFERYDKSIGNLWAFGIWALLVAAIGNAVVFYERIIDGIADDLPSLLDEDEAKVQAWVSHWYQRMFWSRLILLFGVAFGVLLAYINHGLADDFSSHAGKAYVYLMNFVIGLTGGSMFCTMVGIARMMSALGKDVSIRPSVFDTKTSPLRMAIAALWKVALVAALVYALGISSLLLCYSKIQTGGVTLADNKIPLGTLILSGVFGIFIVGYFIRPQLNVHKTLSRLKSQKLQALIGQIETAFDNVAREPTAANIRQLRDLFDLQVIVNGKASWAFGCKELLLLIGSVVIPVLVVLIKCFLDSHASNATP